MSFKKAVRRNKVSGAMFASTFNTGRSAPAGEALAQAQRRQARNMTQLSIRNTWARRHQIGIGLAREIMSEQVVDYRELSRASVSTAL